jgi:DNA-binding MarR family transcriptional regulator
VEGDLVTLRPRSEVSEPDTRLADPSASRSLDDSVAYKITVIADLVARRVSQIAASVGGLNLSQWRVLAAIGDEDGRTASQVVEMTPMDKGIVSRAVASLVSQGHLSRQASDQDGRVSHLYMTDSGRKTFTSILAEIERTGATAEMIVTNPDRAQLLEMLDTIIAAFPR